MKMLDHQDIRWNQSAAEERRKVNQEGEEIAVLEIFAVEYKAGHRHHKQSQHRTHYSDKNSYLISIDEICRVVKQQLIRL
ncbi:hypothetical protein D3C73_1525030 [compost metagenome]